MSMITPPTSDNRLVTTIREGGAGAAVMLVAVFAISLLVQLAVGVAITVGAVLVIGAIIWLAFFRKR
jgi:hypothetical protein